MASRAPKTAPRRPRDSPRRLLYASRIAPSPPKMPPRSPPARPRRPQGSPRASKTAHRASTTPPRALQKRFLRRRAASKSYPDEPSKPPAVALQPLASGLQVASAGSAKRKQLRYMFTATSHMYYHCTLTLAPTITDTITTRRCCSYRHHRYCCCCRSRYSITRV